MIKTTIIPTISFVFGILVSLGVNANTTGGIEEYQEPHTFVATLLVEKGRSGIVIWALPFAHDKEGIEQIKQLFGKNSYDDYRRNHSLFRFVPASIKFGFSDDDGQVKSSFNDDLYDSIMAHYSEKDVALECFAAGEDGVPLCEAYDTENAALNQGLVRKGLAIYNRDNAVKNKAYNDLIIHAQDAAKEDKIGVWVPFHFMLHNISE